MSNLPTCKTCQHFKPFVGFMVGDCDSQKFLQGYNIELAEIPPDSVLVESDEGWAFHVGQDFGCIHHKPKPE